MVSFKTISSTLIMRLFDKKSQKILNVGKKENKMKKEVFFEENRSHLLKLDLYQNENAQIMPVVAVILAILVLTIMYHTSTSLLCDTRSKNWLLSQNFLFHFETSVEEHYFHHILKMLPTKI